jgi:ABC-type uncharacterized transport system substrate-binding protein
VKRRQFITLLGGAAAWPFAASAQQPAMPVVGFSTRHRPTPTRIAFAHFARGLKEAGFVEGENVAIEYRWAEKRFDRLPGLVAELVRRPVAVIIPTGGSVSALAVRTATTTIPIVFTVPEDPVKLGLVASLARPDGNATGFMQFEYSLSGKWVEPLKEIAPGVTRAAVLRDPAITSGIGQFAVIQSVAPTVGLDVSPVNVRDPGEIERAIAAFARTSNSGLIGRPAR